MWTFFRPTRFKLIATAVFLGVIWIVPKANNWFLVHIIFNMYPGLVDSMKEMFTPGFEKFFQQARSGEWAQVLTIFSASRILISTAVAYLGACIIAKLAMGKLGGLRSNSSDQTVR